MVNPLGKIAGLGVGVITSGLRVTASLINSAAKGAKGLAGMASGPSESSGSGGPSGSSGPVTREAPETPKAPDAQNRAAQDALDQAEIEAMAAEAAERELGEEPVDAAAEGSEPEGDELLTPSGVPAAGPGMNPDTAETDLHQPDTEPLLDPATVKAVKKETDVLRAAAEREKR
jgi:hypothetical protein